MRFADSLTLALRAAVLIPVFFHPLLTGLDPVTAHTSRGSQNQPPDALRVPLAARSGPSDVLPLDIVTLATLKVFFKEHDRRLLILRDVTVTDCRPNSDLGVFIADVSEPGTRVDGTEGPIAFVVRDEKVARALIDLKRHAGATSHTVVADGGLVASPEGPIRYVATIRAIRWFTPNGNLLGAIGDTGIPPWGRRIGPRPNPLQTRATESFGLSGAGGYATWLAKTDFISEVSLLAERQRLLPEEAEARLQELAPDLDTHHYFALRIVFERVVPDKLVLVRKTRPETSVNGRIVSASAQMWFDPEPLVLVAFPKLDASGLPMIRSLNDEVEMRFEQSSGGFWSSMTKKLKRAPKEFVSRLEDL